jgi:hypothetical protein
LDAAPLTGRLAVERTTTPTIAKRDSAAQKRASPVKKWGAEKGLSARRSGLFALRNPSPRGADAGGMPRRRMYWN